MAVAPPAGTPQPTPTAAPGGARGASLSAFLRDRLGPALLRGIHEQGRRLFVAALAWAAAFQVLPGLGFYPSWWPGLLPFLIALIGYFFPLLAIIGLGLAVLVPLVAHAPLVAAIFLVSAIILVAIFAPNWPQLLLVVSAPFFGSLGLWFLPPLVVPIIWGGRRVVFTALGALLAFAAAAIGGDSRVAGLLSSGASTDPLLRWPLAPANPLASLGRLGTGYGTDLEAVVTHLSALWQQPYAVFEVAVWVVAVLLLLGTVRSLFILSEGPPVIAPALLDLSILTIALVIAAAWLGLSHWVILPALAALVQPPLAEVAAAAMWMHTFWSLLAALGVAAFLRLLPQPAAP